MKKNKFCLVSITAAVLILTLGLSSAALASAVESTYVLDDPASAIRVTVETQIGQSGGGRVTVEEKATGWKWTNPSDGGGDTLTISSVNQVDSLNLDVNATTQKGYPVAISFELAPSTNDLWVRIGGDSLTTITNNIIYPYPFFTSDGSGYSVFAIDGGFVIPTSLTSWSPRYFNPRMEWLGGTDSSNTHGWIGIVDTPDDMDLTSVTGTVAGSQVIGCAAKWIGSNNNASQLSNRLSYQRAVKFSFFSSGGYVRLAKEFRQYATNKGWLKTLLAKKQEDPNEKVDKLIGAPIIYCWGDGRSSALLDAMKNAGIDKALIQFSVTQTDHNRNFPSDSSWSDQVRSRGYLFGYYDIYKKVRTKGSSPAPYDGFFYLWPDEAVPQWVYVKSDGTLDETENSAHISVERQMEFARDTRLPMHISQRDPDAYFFDTTAASKLQEDYDTTYGHFATRSIDRTNRQALLDTGYSNPLKRLITGTEQGRSWSVPYTHWVEGKYWVGDPGNAVNKSDLGEWNDNSYPSIMTDVVDPTALPGDKLAGLLSDGYQVPLWGLVYHDATVATVHWSRPNNKFLYGWDHYDLYQMLRGNAPLLNLVYQGEQGIAGRVPNTLTDVNGINWSTRWVDIQDRVVQTYNTVCQWHGTVGYDEMIDHQWLSADRSVQMTAFSPADGNSGQAIVVNFGIYDGAYSVTGSQWTGTILGCPVSVAPGEYQTFNWSYPIADAGPNQTACVDEVVNFDGSSSLGNINTYDWDFGDDANASGVTVTHSYTSPGLYTITLTVTDEQEAVDTDSIEVVVEIQEGDITNDCRVNYADLARIADEWLDNGDSDSDLYDDDHIDFRDFALLAAHWLE